MYDDNFWPGGVSYGFKYTEVYMEKRTHQILYLNYIGSKMISSYVVSDEDFHEKLFPYECILPWSLIYKYPVNWC